MKKITDRIKKQYQKEFGRFHRGMTTGMLIHMFVSAVTVGHLLDMILSDRTFMEVDHLQIVVPILLMFFVLYGFMSVMDLDHDELD